MSASQPWSRAVRSPRILLIVMAALWAVACSDDPSPQVMSTADVAEGDVDAADVAPDTEGRDVAPDVEPDAEPDVQPDAPVVCDEPTGGAFWATSVPLSFPLDGQPIMVGQWEDDVLTGGERRDIHFLIDTGATVSCFDLDLTGGDTTPFTAEFLGLGTTGVCDGIVKGCDLAEAEAYIGIDLEVLLGESTLRRLNTFIDYREHRAWFYRQSPDSAPPGMEGVTPLVMPYVRQNELPVAEVGLGHGITLPLLTDTGSGVSIITQAYFDEVEAAEGRALPRLDGYKWATSYGTDDAFVTRLPEVQLGEAVVRGEWVVVIPDDFHIKALLAQTGIVIEGFVGFPHYRHFLTEFRGPAGEFRFWPYPTADPVADTTWHRVGLDVTGRAEGPRVEMIFSPSDVAGKDVALGDTVLSIDGQDVTGADADTVRGLLHGVPGETRTLVLRRGGAGGEVISVETQVDDLLPL